MNRDALQTNLEALAASFAAMDDAYLMPSALTPLLAAADELQAALIEQLNDTYLADEGATYRLTVIVNVNPNSDEALDTVQSIRAILTEYGDHAVVSGQPTILTDIRDTHEPRSAADDGAGSSWAFLSCLRRAAQPDCADLPDPDGDHHLRLCWG